MNEPRVSIRVVGVEKKLGSTQALRGVSADFSSLPLHGVIGPEGAGKTTLFRTLMGLLRPDEGEVVYRQGGESVAFPVIRERVAYMPQRQSLYPDLSVGEHLDFFRELYSIPEGSYRERRDRLLHITRLDRFADRRAGQLSGGMYKKLGLMCALLQSPDVLLLDEPTNGVDPISRRELWDLLHDLASQRILTVVATAYMDEAERCDIVHFLHGGRLLAEGEPRDVLAKKNLASFDELFLRHEGEGG